MKTIRFFAVIILMLCVSISKAQGISFTYDAAGNRIQRMIVFKSTEANMDSTAVTKPHTDNLGEMKIIIYPNPTSGKLSVELENIPNGETGEIAMYNMEGRLIQQTGSLEPINHLDLSTYQKGIYILRITVGQKVSEWKVIKQ
jgi:hypothetical protein